MNGKEKNNKIEAEILIDYAKNECNDIKIVLSMLDVILTNKAPETLDGWNWKIARFIDDRTSYISLDIDADIDFETGDWGLPVAIGGRENYIGIKVEDKDNLMILRQEVENISNHTTDKISRFVSMKEKPKWNCQKCGRFLGKELSSIDEIKKLLRDFNIGKHWKCRSCKLPNYFEFTDDGIIFKSGY